MPVALPLKRGKKKKRKLVLWHTDIQKINQIKLGIVNGNQWTAKLYLF